MQWSFDHSVAELDVTRSSLYMRKKSPISVSPVAVQCLGSIPLVRKSARSHLGTVAPPLLTFITSRKWFLG